VVLVAVGLDAFADIVQERAALGYLAVEPQFRSLVALQ